ncbi:MAG: Rab family GTPase [Candidatus Hodarchaeales archaeon]|jgi:small GTP-binding protein
METITCKVVICGDYAVGKTTLVKLFLGENFQNSYKPTIGVDIGRKIVQIENQKILFQVWDLSGQHSFQPIRRQFYSHSNGALLIFDISRRETYQNILKWTEELIEQTGQIPLVLIANKIDLREKFRNSVTLKEGKNLSELISEQTGTQTQIIEVSAVHKQNNLEPFFILGKSILEQNFA